MKRTDAEIQELSRKEAWTNLSTVSDAGEFQVRYRTLYRDPASEVGLSFKEGTPLRVVEDLPSHAIETIVFRDARTAGVFVEGARTVGLGNSMALGWDPTIENGANVVFVARFDRDRPDAATIAEAIGLRPHVENDYDHKHHVAFMERHHEKQSQDHARHLEERRPVVEAMKGAGFKLESSALNWARFDPGAMVVEWKGPNGPYSFTASAGNAFHYYGDEVARVDVSEPVAILAESHGLRLDLEDRDLVRDHISSVDELPALAKSAVFVASKGERMVREENHRRFRESVKMTPPRRRFLLAAENGIRALWNRGNMAMRAGAEEIKASEIHIMWRMGWIDGGKIDRPEHSRDWKVTEAGVAAAREPQPKRGRAAGPVVEDEPSAPASSVRL